MKWEYDTSADGEPNEFHSEPLLTETLVIVGSDLREPDGVGHLYAFDRETGEVRWKNDVPIGIPVKIWMKNSRVYVVDFGQSLLVFDLTTGKEIYRMDGQSKSKDFLFPASPAAQDDALFYATRNGTVRAINVLNHKTTWQRSFPAQITTDLAVSGKGLFLGTSEKRIYELDQQTGKTLRTIETKGVVRWKLLSENNRLIFLEWNDEFMPVVKAIDVDSGKEMWSQPSPQGSKWDTFRPFFWSNLVLVGSDHGELFAFDSQSGKPMWSFLVEGGIRSIGASEHLIYAGCSNGYLYAILPT